MDPILVGCGHFVQHFFGNEGNLCQEKELRKTTFCHLVPSRIHNDDTPVHGAGSESILN